MGSSTTLDRQPAVSDGQRVRCGDYLAGVGDTGNAAQAGPHLHIGIGPEIVRGTGPYGGTGGDFDAVGLLRAALAGAAEPAAIPGFDFDVAEQAIANATWAGLPPLLMLALAHGAGGLKRPFPSGDGGRRHGPYQIDGATYPGYAPEHWWEIDNVYAVPEIVGRWKRTFAAHGSWKVWWYDHYSFIRDWAPDAQESEAWSDEKAHHCIGHALDTFVLFHREQQRRLSTQPVGPDPRDARIAHLEALVREAAEQQETAAQRLRSALG